MTRVDFYLLADGDDPHTFACRLTEKAWQQGHAVYLHVGDAAMGARLDERLWTFRPGSFVPHALAGTEPETPVHIGHREEPGEHHDVLVNLGAEVPLFFSRFERVAEVIGGNETARQAGRERYRFYRERGYTLEVHEMGQST